MRARSNIPLLLLLLAGCASSRPVPPEPRPIVYSCAGGLTFNVRFTRDAAHVTLPSGQEMTLPQQPVGSGMRYGTGDTEFRGKGEDASLTIKERRIVGCRAQR
jgi:membrane-bound inhibitor of C-type lysozyme